MLRKLKTKIINVGNSKVIPVTKILSDDMKGWGKITVEVQRLNKKSFVIKISERKI